MEGEKLDRPTVVVIGVQKGQGLYSERCESWGLSHTCTVRHDVPRGDGGGAMSVSGCPKFTTNLRVSR